jgi:hypothetical protein
LNNIPTIIRGIVPISYSDLPDYYRKFEREELERYSTEVSKEEVMENHYANNFKDFSDTERKLAEIWRDVLCLSEEQCKELNKESDFLDLLPSWCGTFEINFLNKKINQIFQIPIDSICQVNYSTIKELAAWIDRFQNHGQES